MSKKHWMPFFIGDYLKDTRILSQGQHGAYVLLLFHYWESRKPIPYDEAQQNRIALAFSDEEADNVRFVLNEFFQKTGSGYIHKRLDELIEKANAKAEKSRENGLKGGRPKIENNPEKTQQVSKTKAKENPTETHEETQNITIPDPEPEEEFNKLRLGADAPDRESKKSKISDAARDLSAHLKEKLKKRGQDYFPKDWHLGTGSVFEAMLKNGCSQPDLMACIDWAVLEWKVRDTVTHGTHIQKAWGHWRAAQATEKLEQKKGTTSLVLEALEAGEAVVYLPKSVIIPASMIETPQDEYCQRAKAVKLLESGEYLELGLLRVYDSNEHRAFQYASEVA